MHTYLSQKCSLFAFLQPSLWSEVAPKDAGNSDFPECHLLWFELSGEVQPWGQRETSQSYFVNNQSNDLFFFYSSINPQVTRKGKPFSRVEKVDVTTTNDIETKRKCDVNVSEAPLK